MYFLFQDKEADTSDVIKCNVTSTTGLMTSLEKNEEF